MKWANETHQYIFKIPKKYNALTSTYLENFIRDDTNNERLAFRYNKPQWRVNKRKIRCILSNYIKVDGYDVYEMITGEKFKHISMVVTFEDLSIPTLAHPPTYFTFAPSKYCLLESKEIKLKEIWK